MEGERECSVGQLREKREAYTTMTAADKRDAKARAAAARPAQRAGPERAGGGAELVAVELTCAAADRVVVRLAFPALAAP